MSRAPSSYMSTYDIGGPLPMSIMWSTYIDPPSHLPLDAHGCGPKEGSKMSRHVSRHRRSGALCPQAAIYSQEPPDIIYTPATVGTTPDPNDRAPVVQSDSNLSKSHGCQSSRLPHGPSLHNASGYPTQSVDHNPLLEPQQCGPASDASQSDASWDDEFLIYGTQGKRPAFHLTNDALPPDISSIARGVGSPPLSQSSSAASIPEGGQISAPPASISLAPNNVPFLRSREDQQYREVWTLPIASMVTPVGAIRYQDNDGEASIVSSSPQESNHQVSYKPRSIQRHRRVLPNFVDTSSSSSRSSPMYVGSFSAASPPFQGTPQRPSRYAKNLPEKEHWCPSCGAGFSKSQALGRHVKDMHKVKIPCIHCASFAWPRGRRYLYQRHLKMQHPQIIPPEVRRRVKIREP